MGASKACALAEPLAEPYPQKVKTGGEDRNQNAVLEKICECQGARED